MQNKRAECMHMSVVYEMSNACNKYGKSLPPVLSWNITTSGRELRILNYN